MRDGNTFSLLLFTLPDFAITVLHIDVHEDVVKECLGGKKCKVIIVRQSAFNWLLRNRPNAQIVLQGSHVSSHTRLDDLLTMCKEVFDFIAKKKVAYTQTKEEWEDWVDWDCELIDNK